MLTNKMMTKLIKYQQTTTTAVSETARKRERERERESYLNYLTYHRNKTLPNSLAVVYDHFTHERSKNEDFKLYGMMLF